MSNNEILATFSGWVQVPVPCIRHNGKGGFDHTSNILWQSPKGWGRRTVKTNNPPGFTTDYNLFVPVFNKAVDELCSHSRNPESRWLFEKLDMMEWKFTISTRLPILLEIISFLNKHKV